MAITGRGLWAFLLAYAQVCVSQPQGGDTGGPGGGSQQPQVVNVTVSGTLSLSGPNAAASLEALRGLQLAHYLQQLMPSVGQTLNVNLDIRDDAGDASRLTSLYETMISQNQGFQVFVGPITRELSEVAASITSNNSKVLMLPFVSLQALQRSQSPTSVFSLEVPPYDLLKMPMWKAYQKGARTLALWEHQDEFYSLMCNGTADEAAALGMEVVLRHKGKTAEERLLVDVRHMAAISPDAVIICGDYKMGVEVMMAMDFIHFSPKAVVAWESQHADFSGTLLAASALNVLGSEVWSTRLEPCNLMLDSGCTTFTRADFFTSFKGLFGTDPTLLAAQAAAALLAATYLVPNAFQSSTTGDTLTALVTELLSGTGKESFYHPLVFDDFGFLTSALIESTQLEAMNLTEARRLQTQPQQQQQQQQQPQQQQQQQLPVEPLSAEALAAYTTLTPVLKGVHVTEEAGTYQPLYDIVYPRDPVEERKVVRYPCDLGFEVRTTSLLMMVDFAARNVSGGPTTPCSPCMQGQYRDIRSSQCTSCPAGMQATSRAQPQCTECLPGSVCNPIDSTLVVAPDYHLLHGLLIPCGMEGRCLGENQCLGNSDGALCAQCKEGYTSDPERELLEADPCRPCEQEWADKWHRIIIGCCVYLAAYFILLTAHWNACDSLMSTSVFIWRALVNHLHFTSITVQAAGKGFVVVTLLQTRDYFLGLTQLVLDPLGTIPINCLIPSWNLYEVQALLGLCIIPAVVITSATLFSLWEFILCPLLQIVLPKEGHRETEEEDDQIHSSVSFKMRGKSVHHSANVTFSWRTAKPSWSRVLTRLSESVCIWVHLLLPMALANLLGALLCVDPEFFSVAVVDYPRPIAVQLADFGVQCSQGIHTLWTILSLTGILLYALGIPAALVALIHALFKEDSADSHRAFGYLLDGSSADFFYIQLVIILLMASSLVFGNYLTLGTLFRVVWLLGVYSSYSLVISAIKPFDARDKNVLLRLELTSMACQKVLLVGRILQSNWAPLLAAGMPKALIEVPWTAMHFLFVLGVMKGVINNSVLKRIMYVTAVEDLTTPERWIFDFMGMDREKVKLDVAAQTLDISSLKQSSRETLQATITLALERYFEAASEGIIPWSEVCDDSQVDEPETTGNEGLKGQLHPGFLSAAIHESLVEVETSRRLKKICAENTEKTGLLASIRKWCSSLLQADDERPDEESMDTGGQNLAEKFSEERAKVHEQLVLSATAEELYMAMTVLLPDIEHGRKEMFDMRPKAENTKRVAQTEEEKPLDEILEEVTASTKNFDEEYDESEASGLEFELPEPVKEEETDGRLVPALLQKRDVPELNDHPDAVLARMLGLQNARGARDNMASLQEEHQKYFYEIIELKSEIQELHRHIVEGQAELAQLEMESHGLDHLNSREHTGQLHRGDPGLTGAGHSPSADSVAEELRSLGLQEVQTPIFHRVVKSAGGPGPEVPRPRSPRHPKLDTPTTEQYITEGPDTADAAQPYPVDRRYRSRVSQRPAGSAQAQPRPLAANLKESTITVKDSSFWSKAPT